MSSTESRGATAALGTSLHGGWAIFVTISAKEGVPAVLDRRRVELVGSDLPGQPFLDEARELSLDAAAELIGRVHASALESSVEALTELANELSDAAPLETLALPEMLDLPEDLEEVLASYRAIYLADRRLYEMALAEAAISLGLRVKHYSRGSEFDFAAEALDVEPYAIRAFCRELGLELGAPWQKDHQGAAAAAIGALAGESRVWLGAWEEPGA